MSEHLSRVASPAVQRVLDRLAALGHSQAPVVLDDAARTAPQAAEALGVALGQIAKSIVFRRKSDDRAVLVVTSGDRRVDEKKVQALVCAGGGKLGRADADFVKAATGFSIGGVSPLAHATEPVTLIDRDLFRFDVVWAAAGHPHAVFPLAPQDLQRYTGAPVADVALDDPHAPPLRGSLPPEGADPAWGGPAPDRDDPRAPPLRGSLPPEGADPAWGGPAPDRA